MTPTVTVTAAGETTTATYGAVTPAAVPAWSDEFTGLTVDRTKWNVRTEAEGGTRLGYCQPANVTVQPDGLHITCRREAVGGRQYTTGYVDSIGRFSALTGRWEIVAKLPTARGMWPAGWLRCDTSAGEIDIFECVGGMPSSVVQTVHQATDGSMDRSGYEAKPAGFNPADFHTYSLARAADGTVTWAIDGVVTRTRKPTDLDNQKQPMTWLNGPTFASPLNLRINLQVGGSMPTYYGLNVDATTALPDDFVIRSVRYYR